MFKTKAISYLLIVVLLFHSCNKIKLYDEVKYEVILIDCTSWHGSFINEKAEVLGVTNGTNNWKYSFKNKNGLIIAQIDAYPENYPYTTTDVIMRIYVNDKVVAEGKGSISPRLQIMLN